MSEEFTLYIYDYVSQKWKTENEEKINIYYSKTFPSEVKIYIYIDLLIGVEPKLLINIPEGINLKRDPSKEQKLNQKGIYTIILELLRKPNNDLVKLILSLNQRSQQISFHLKEGNYNHELSKVYLNVN